MLHGEALHHGDSARFAGGGRVGPSALTKGGTGGIRSRGERAGLEMGGGCYFDMVFGVGVPFHSGARCILLATPCSASVHSIPELRVDPTHRTGTKVHPPPASWEREMLGSWEREIPQSWEREILASWEREMRGKLANAPLPYIFIHFRL